MSLIKKSINLGVNVFKHSAIVGGTSALVCSSYTGLYLLSGVWSVISLQNHAIPTPSLGLFAALSVASNVLLYKYMNKLNEQPEGIVDNIITSSFVKNGMKLVVAPFLTCTGYIALCGAKMVWCVMSKTGSFSLPSLTTFSEVAVGTIAACYLVPKLFERNEDGFVANILDEREEKGMEFEMQGNL